MATRTDRTMPEDDGLYGSIRAAIAAGPPWYRRFFTALRKAPNVAVAIRATGKARTTVYRYKREDALFSAAWDEVLELALDDLEGDVWKRAHESDPLAKFLLERRRPEVYGKVATVNHQHSGTVDVQLLPPPQLHDVIALLQEAGALQLPPGDIIDGESSLIEG